jgi:hypothetical protein
MWNFFSKYDIKKCSDGTERMIYKKVDDAFPICFKNISSSYKAVFEAINEVKVNLSADNKSRIHDLLLKLDSINTSMQIQFRAAYVVYQGEPCSKSDYLASEIQKITERENINRRLQIFMDKIILIKKGRLSDTALKNLIIEAKSILLGPGISKNILTNLSQVTETVDTWQEE